MLAPIVLFVYNRLDCLKKTIESLKENNESKNSIIYIYSDNYNDSSSREKVEEVRRYIKTIEGFKKVFVIERDRNYGLAKNIINGVTEVVNKHFKVIVLEDDLVVGKYFLKYMNDGLNMYESNNSVISIHGYSYFANNSTDETYFIKTADNLGWATWKSRWQLFEPNAEKLYEKIVSHSGSSEFDRNNAYPFTKMLKMQADRELNSWAIRWYATAFIHKKYTLYPCKSLVFHIGDGADATNYKRKQTKNDPLSVPIYNGKINVKKIEVRERSYITGQYIKFLQKYRKPLFKRVINRIWSIVGDKSKNS